MKKIVRLKESELVRVVRKVIREQAPTDVYNPNDVRQVKSQMDEFDWKSHFDQLKNELDSYFSTIEGPIDVKRYQTKVMNAYYQMVGNVDDEYSYPSHGRDFQQLTNDFMSHFTNKLNELIRNYGRLRESNLTRIIKKVIQEQSVDKNCLLKSGFVKTTIGGPQVSRSVYQKEVQGVIYDIGMDKTGTPKKELTINKRDSDMTMTCSSWACDSSKSIGIRYSGCVSNRQNYY